MTSTTNIDEAFSHMTISPSSSPSTFPHSNLIIALPIPIDSIGLILGKSGKTINYLEKSCKVSLRLQDAGDIKVEVNERCLIIEGEPAPVTDAAFKVVKLLANRKMGESSSISSSTANATSTKSDSKLEFRNDNQLNIERLVSHFLFDYLVEGGGIKYLFEQTGASITTDKALLSDNER